MEDKEKIPYIVHEGVVARMERIIKRLTIALVICILLIFASNALWLYFWNQYNYTGETQSIMVDSKDGIANYIGNDGSIVNGSDNSDQEEKDSNAEEQIEK